MIDSQSLGSISANHLSPNVPALFTRISTRPKRSCAERTMPRQTSKSPTSPGATSTRPGGPRMSATFRSASLLSRALMTTLAPAPASIAAIARPIPRDEPVTIATESRISIRNSVPRTRGLFDSLRPTRPSRLTGAEDRTGQAGRAAFRLQGDFSPAVGPNAASRVLQPPLRDRVAFKHDAIARRDREDIRAHRVELLVRHLNELEPVFLEELPERDRDESRIDHREVVIA